jgi:chromosome segregation ATPase
VQYTFDILELRLRQMETLYYKIGRELAEQGADVMQLNCQLSDLKIEKGDMERNYRSETAKLTTLQSYTETRASRATYESQQLKKEVAELKKKLNESERKRVESEKKHMESGKLRVDEELRAGRRCTKKVDELFDMEDELHETKQALLQANKKIKQTNQEVEDLAFFCPEPKLLDLLRGSKKEVEPTVFSDDESNSKETESREGILKEVYKWSLFIMMVVLFV